MSGHGDTLVYLYGILASARRPSARSTPRGLPGATPPVLLPGGEGIWLVAAEVPAALYGPRQLEKSLGDIDWVSRRALAHEAVVEHFAANGVLAPAKLFTLFSSSDRAAAHVRRRERSLRKVFHRIAGKEEWGVRLRLETLERRGPPPPLQASRSGTAFLRAKRDARLAREDAAARGLRKGEHLYRTLSSGAEEAVRRSVPRGARVLLDAVFLVRRRQAAGFRSLARREAAAAEREGLRLEVSGPWPPYHFAGAGV